MPNYYEMYKNDYMKCPFCGKSNNLQYIKQHLKSKTCLKCQDQYKQNNNFDAEMLNLQQNINNLKSQIKLESE